MLCHFPAITWVLQATFGFPFVEIILCRHHEYMIWFHGVSTFTTSCEPPDTFRFCSILLCSANHLHRLLTLSNLVFGVFDLSACCANSFPLQEVAVSERMSYVVHLMSYRNRKCFSGHTHLHTRMCGVCLNVAYMLVVEYWLISPLRVHNVARWWLSMFLCAVTFVVVQTHTCQAYNLGIN